MLRDVTYLKTDGIRCSGYFEDSEKLLVVAMKSPIALEILVHEFGHLTQYLDNCKPWKNLGDSLDNTFSWLSGKSVSNIEKHIDAVKLMELDNERRSVQIIKKFNLKIDIKLYIKKANSYIYFYNMIKKTRRWSSPNNSPYNNKNILAIMPDKFQKTYKTTPKKIQTVFEQENI